VGQVVARGATELIVDISSNDRHLLQKGAGVRNPDGTAAGLRPLKEAAPGKGGAGGPEGTHSGGHEPTPSPSVARGR
jgi:hypothetical protein